MMAITGALSVAEWRSIDEIFGYPKVAEVKDFGDKGATLYRMVVEEPRVIYLWMKLDGDSDIRAYKIPYSRSIAKDEKAGTDGDPARVQFKPKNLRGGGARSGEEPNAGNSGGTYEMYILPPPIVPEKLNSR
jgi:hypothetical protein